MRKLAMLVSTLVLGGAMLMTSMVTAEESAKLEAGDRIVFLGDSITQQGAGKEGYVTMVAEALAKDHADLKIEVIGAGISGHKVPNLEARLDKDVLDKNPTKVIIYIGINDVWHSQSGRGTSKEDFEAGLGRLITRIREKGATPLLCTASVIGEKTDGSNDLDTMLAEYCEISRKVAAANKVQLIDLNKAFWEHIKANNPENKDRGILTGDRVHLNKAGNAFVAKQMLAALGAATETKQTLRHVVLFKFKDDVTKEQVQEVVDAFAALPAKIPTITGFEWGTDVSIENKAAGFTHGFVVSFATAKDRDDYIPHPAHAEFVKLVGPRLDNVLVFDFFLGK
ncbi:Stress responsive alpha-beta barrel domain protein [Pirellula staleyi DSM 6068]|uniref:Stress responsive alpha-beta barrel domain protein n=1 Tax=Pirellula staleyi (strain ATCC 27377 / DSM 6068 / ICPB 4128) TaxID=530564 RepID=D2R645_PIRSD|nr:Dabb family protein [Pirellula staleyi]ADB19130.1 Stress responsive alpha-beta barrel domain protein [Pirellula staleyi DSM 6068]